MADALLRLKAILAEVVDIGRAVGVLDWDQETYMPPGGGQNRADQLSTLSEVAHRRFTPEEEGALLHRAEGGGRRKPSPPPQASPGPLTPPHPLPTTHPPPPPAPHIPPRAHTRP